MKFFDKVKWILGLLVVFLLILGTNLLDRRNFKKIRTSIVSIYENRLLAKGIVYEMSDLVHKKEIAFYTQDSVFFERRNNRLNVHLDSLLEEFTFTRLTPFEETVFEMLIRDVGELYNIEKQQFENGYTSNEVFMPKVDDIKKKLGKLADIQMREGKRLFDNSEGVLNSMQLHTQIELYFLVAIAIIIQLLIVIKPKD